MSQTTLRKVGTSVMTAGQPAALDALDHQAGPTVNAEADDGRLVERSLKPRYTVEALLAQCVGYQEITAEEREWLDAPAVGNEII